MNNERRYKRIFINENQLLSLFRKPWFMKKDKKFFFIVNHLEGLPGDYNVIAVHYDFSYAAWCLIIESKEFDPIEIGYVIPILEWKESIIQKTEQYEKIESYVSLF